MELKIGNNRTVFYQWDSGQVLVVTGADTCEEVHFCSKAVTDALVCKIREENGMRVADVPNILLQAEMPITAYLFARREDGSETCCSRSFPVLRRPKPESYVYIQTEVLDYGNLDRRLAALEGDGMAAAVEAYLKDNPVEAGATAEEAAQIAENRDNIAQINEAVANGVKNPNVLTFTGAVSASYDGSKAVEVEIPSGGDSKWVELLNVTLTEEAAFEQIVDYSYNEYVFCFIIPKGITTLSTGAAVFLGTQNVTYFQNIATNANYAFKFLAHARKVTDTLALMSLTKTLQNEMAIDKSPNQGCSYVSAPTLYPHNSGHISLKNALPIGTLIAIYAR